MAGTPHVDGSAASCAPSVELEVEGTGFSEKRLIWLGHVCVRRMSVLRRAGFARKASRDAEVKAGSEGVMEDEVKESRLKAPPNAAILSPEESVRTVCLPGIGYEPSVRSEHQEKRGTIAKGYLVALNGLRLDQDYFVSSEQAVEGTSSDPSHARAVASCRCRPGPAWPRARQVLPYCPAFLKGMEALISSVKEL